ncbi:hypothetical protein JDV02_008207 [Purpureocillium takamizusanense]|uniref:Uncharacterized protein n=1 Tax=Purpureocillium takamizusanense TaxID=2060973 RepID=A0A9Q8VE53_9HYPO|nr:uncharacterized protein JDV02_008207 [Purpureocillium takamizusanense]UNI22308.1 hypothetical protein JDV02_008207 [Purpureocillium takamizusanense]
MTYAMPHRHEHRDGDPHYDLDYGQRRPTSPSRHRDVEAFAHAPVQGHVHEAGLNPKSALTPRSERRHDSRHERGCYREPDGRRGRDAFDGNSVANPRRLRSAEGHRRPETHHHRPHPHHHHHHRRRHSSAGGSARDAFVEAATAAAAAGLLEAVRARHNPNRSTRAVTAAVGAAAVDVLVSKGEFGKRGRHIAEGAIGGLAVDRLANGPSKASSPC